jgi:hypothetical protein
MNESFLISLKNYLSHITDSIAWNLGFPAIMLGGFLLLTFIIAYFYCKREQKEDAEEKHATITRKILCSMYLSGVITLFITTIVVICLMKFTAFFGNTFCQFGVVMGFLLIGILSFIAYLQFCKKTKKKEMAIYNVPISQSAMSSKLTHLKSVLNKKLVLFFVVAAPFLLLLINNKSQSLVSIVLDNSGSMSYALPYGINSMETILAQTPHKGQYVFTTLTIAQNKEIKDTTVNQYFNTIVNTKRASDLSTSTETFTDTRALINAFSQVGDAGGSAIYQGIWQNYLVARDFSSSVFQSKKMIIISDGEDDLYYYAPLPGQKWNKKDIFQQKGQVGESPADFFDGGIYCINLGESDSKYLYDDCTASIEVYDGTDQQSYFNALAEILPEMYFDWFLIYFIIGILSLTFAALLISKSTIK